MLWEHEETRTLVHIGVGEMQDGAVAMEIDIKVPQKIKNRAAIWSSNPSSGYLSKKSGIKIWTAITISKFMTALFSIEWGGNKNVN